MWLRMSVFRIGFPLVGYIGLRSLSRGLKLRERVMVCLCVLGCNCCALYTRRFIKMLLMHSLLAYVDIKEGNGCVIGVA